MKLLLLEFNYLNVIGLGMKNFSHGKIKNKVLRIISRKISGIVGKHDFGCFYSAFIERDGIAKICFPDWTGFEWKNSKCDKPSALVLNMDKIKLGDYAYDYNQLLIAKITCHCLASIISDETLYFDNVNKVICKYFNVDRNKMSYMPAMDKIKLMAGDAGVNINDFYDSYPKSFDDKIILSNRNNMEKSIIEIRNVLNKYNVGCFYIVFCETGFYKALYMPGNMNFERCINKEHIFSTSYLIVTLYHYAVQFESMIQGIDTAIKILNK